MTTVSITATNAGVPVNGLTDDPEITIQRSDTGAEVVSDDAMTDRATRGLYTYDFNLVDGLQYSFTIDADPQATGQVEPEERYFAGSFDLELEEANDLLRNQQILNATTAKVELYDDAGVKSHEADAFMDEAATQPYDGSGGVVRRGRFVKV